MKKYTKLSLLLALTCLSLFFTKQASADVFSDEGTAFYALTSPSGYVVEGTVFYAFDPQSSQPSGTIPVYRYFNSSNGDHFYTTDNTINYSPSGYSSEGVAFYAYDPNTTLPNNAEAVYRFFNGSNSKHFYTASAIERDALINNPQWGYSYEGTAFNASSTQQNGTVPVYRFFNPNNGDHFYTALENEKNAISQAPVYRFFNPKTGDHFFTASENEKSIVANTSQSGYIPEGAAFYAYNTQMNGAVPVYRFFNTKNGFHFFTISEDEKNSLISNSQSGYTYEGIAFYAFSSQTNGTTPVYRLYDSTANNHFYTISADEKNRLLTPALGPDISVGLWNYSKSDIESTPFQIDANKTYNIKDGNGIIIAQVGANSTTKVSYDDNHNLFTISGPLNTTLSNTSITFDAADGDNTTMIFNVHRPSSSFDHYRGKIKIQYYHGSDIVGGSGTTVTQFWIDNILPLEEYVWGMGETTGTGPMEHTKVMTTIFRTYGFWYIKYANKYSAYGFKIRSDSGSQIYNGYDWESQYTNIKKAAQQTRSIFASYGGDVALTPYSSWSDGHTRSFQEVWGSTDYPWCQSVSDPYGKNSSLSTAQLQAAGNHMVGLIANGSLNMANQGWSFDKILKYYYSGISLPTNY